MAHRGLQSDSFLKLNSGLFFMSQCNGKAHDLKVVYSNNLYMYAEIVRWCETCGAIVIDIDCDGRVSPGAIMKMKFPSHTQTSTSET